MISTVFYFIDLFFTFTWPVILAGDFYLWRWQKPRMCRGKYARFLMRHTIPHPIAVVLAFIGVWSVCLCACLVTQSLWAFNFFWAYVLVTDAIDWITGGEDPPWKRWVEAGSKVKDKLKIKPAPRPAIDLS